MSGSPRVWGLFLGSVTGKSVIPSAVGQAAHMHFGVRLLPAGLPAAGSQIGPCPGAKERVSGVRCAAWRGPATCEQLGGRS